MNLINIAHAQVGNTQTDNGAFDIMDLVGWFIRFINETLIYLIFALAFLLFLWGVFKYFFGSGSNAEENRREGSKFILWSVIGFAVMISIWGIVNVIVNTFPFEDRRPDLPCFEGNNCNTPPPGASSGSN